MQVIDLSQPLCPTMPHFPGDPQFASTAVSSIAATGFAIDQYCLIGQHGTHLDAPSHMDPHGKCLSELAAEQLVAPLVVLNISSKVKADPNYAAQIADIEEFEQLYGLIPPNACVCIYTGQAEFWDQPNRYLGLKSGAPGWAETTIKFLVTQRKIVAIGHDAPNTDPAPLVAAEKFPAQKALLTSGCWQLENLNRLEQVPPVGATIIAAVPRVVGASGFPLRPLALLS